MLAYRAPYGYVSHAYVASVLAWAARYAILATIGAAAAAIAFALGQLGDGAYTTLGT